MTRLSSDIFAGLRPASYTVNSLNQYSQRTVPSAVDVIGMAEPDATVQVNGQNTYRRGEYFQKAVTVENGDNPVYQAVNVTAGTASSSGHVFVPKTPEAFTYDADGNLIQDGRWNYTWDAENRLVEVASKDNATGSSWKRMQYAYDWQGRRISKRVYASKNLAANRATLLDFTSQYAEGWAAAKTIDNNLGGAGGTWCSAANPGPQQAFIYQINYGLTAPVGEVVFYNYGEEEYGCSFYSRNFEVYVSTDADWHEATWTLVLNGELAARTGPQSYTFNETQAIYVKLVITSGYRPSYWELSEFQISGKPTDEARFVYDGWNCIGELNNQLAVVKSYAWGLDLSGTLQGAGGVGGLVMERVHTGPNAGTYFPAFDGNGNVTALVKGSDGSKAAVYEYGPFAQLLRATGPMAKDNPFRFSTKYCDEETGLIYYPFRYYSPNLARWLSQDPISEKGGINLYGFVGNCPVDSLDPFGLRYGPGYTPGMPNGIPDNQCSSISVITMNPRPQLDKSSPFDLWYSNYLNRRPFHGYSDVVWSGVLNADQVQGHLNKIYKAVYDICTCCYKDSRPRGKHIDGYSLTPEGRESVLNWTLAGIYAGLAIGSAELNVGDTFIMAYTEDGKCMWRAKFKLSVKDLYTFKSYNTDWSMALPWYTWDNNYLLRNYFGPWFNYGRDFWINDDRDITIQGEVCCIKGLKLITP